MSFLKKNYKWIVIIIVVIVIISAFIGIWYITSREQQPQPRVVGGELTKDETWTGMIHVAGTVLVPEGITLTILPGTFIEFKHYRGYKNPNRINLEIRGGTVKAIGSAENPIWFTSDAEIPINGDWGGIACLDTTDTEFKYVIVEFAIIGIEQFNCTVNISHSIIRYVNTEGLYAEQSTATFEYNLIYANAYHDIALENYNKHILIRNNILGNSHFGIHAEATNFTAENNYFVNYTNHAITAGQHSNVTIKNNKFENIGLSPAIELDPTTTNSSTGNDFGNGSIPIPTLDFQDIKRYELNYIPGDKNDQFMYVYDTVDETRQIVKRLWNGSFGFSLTYGNNSLWRFNIGPTGPALYPDFIRIDPITGDNVTYWNDIVINPRGLAYDGTYLYR